MANLVKTRIFTLLHKCTQRLIIIDLFSIFIITKTLISLLSSCKDTKLLKLSEKIDRCKYTIAFEIKSGLYENQKGFNFRRMLVLQYLPQLHR